MKLLTIFSFIARLLWSCGIWCLVFWEFIGLCQCLSLGYLLVGNVNLVTIVMEIYGWLFLIVWCGAFGRREIVGVLKTLSVPCLTSNFYFSELYWTLFWIYLIFVMFVLDLFTLVYPLCTWVFFFYFYFYQWIFITYQKKKNYNCFSDSYLLETTCVLRIYLQIHNCFLSFFQSFLYPCSIFIFFRKVGRGGGWG